VCGGRSVGSSDNSSGRVMKWFGVANVSGPGFVRALL
jgi:hypothetical protein